MDKKLSQRTIFTCIPTIKAIFSVLDLELFKYKDMDKKNEFHLFSLKNNFSDQDIYKAMDVIFDIKF